MSLSQQLLQSLSHGFIHNEQRAVETLKPKLLTNNANEQVLYPLLQELERCHAFSISVAFITTGGLTMLKAALADLAAKNRRGRILTSTYLQFNQPHMFKQLLRLPNVDVRVTPIQGFHAKGYIFEHSSYKTFIVGSSNLTESALKTNYEWNVKLNSLQDGDLIQKFEQQFEHVWQQATPLTEKWLKAYEQQYVAPSQIMQAAEQVAPYVATDAISPNRMQQQALTQLHAVRASGEQRALVISATGTGKTYLAAFDVLQARPKRMLFIVHREQILTKAMTDFQRVLKLPAEEFGLVAGSTRQLDRRYVFATIQTLAKDDVLQAITADAFDYILIDEVHKAGAASYLRVIEHFTPSFLLGMTATPERTDDFNIFELFHYNIAYEIRLQQALAENMLCPFHYFGVSEHTAIDNKATLQQLLVKERVAHIIEKIEYYGYCGETVKGLMFCSKKEEARALSEALNERGYHTAALTGDDSIDVRERVVTQLEEGTLDYILTVDIFNEGIDIPLVNQVVMLRQTQSSIIFIQQLGRGLRKHASKEYVTVIDFIGNYQNNYMIPMALSGDYSYNKDNLRRHTSETMYIQGLSSIHFERIAKERIFDAINVKTLLTLKMMKKQFTELQHRLGRTPLLEDFMKHRLLDPELLVKNKKHYAAFLLDAQVNAPTISTEAEGLLTFMSTELLNGKRLHEVLLLKLLLRTPKLSKNAFIELLRQCKLPHDEETIASMERMLTLKFATEQSRTAYKHVSAITVSTHYEWTEEAATALQSSFVQLLVNDVLQCALRKNEQYTTAPLTLHAKYSRKDYCRLQNWQKDVSSVVYGYKIDEATTTCPLFIRYHKDEKLNTAVLYEDELLNTTTLKWYTRHGKTIDATVEQRILYDDSLTLDIFIQKDGAEGTDFYYLGRATPLHDTIEQHTILKDNTPTPIVSVHLQMAHEIDEAIYHYLTHA